MTIRQTRADTASRTHSNIARATVKKINDKTKVQELDLEILKDEEKVEVERFQNYGFTSHPMSPSGKEKAEAIVAFIGSNRSHAVVLGVDDRRHRPKDMKEGETQVYDDQGQKVHLSRDQITISSKKKIVLQIEGGSSMITIEKDKITISSNAVEVTAADVEFKKK